MSSLHLRSCLVVACLTGLCVRESAADDWQPKQAPVMTRWAKDVSPEKVHPEYPRPQMVREKWVNLNGLWEYAIASEANAKPEKWDGKILVPFPVESALSGVMRRVPENGKLWYRRSFATPEMAKDGRLLLHFGASDWETVVWVNGQKVGEHRGGYDPFTFDITDALKRSGAGAAASRKAEGASRKAAVISRGAAKEFSRGRKPTEDVSRESPSRVAATLDGSLASPLRGFHDTQAASPGACAPGCIPTSLRDCADADEQLALTARLLADGENELIVAVSDPTDGSFQPRGKQVRKPNGIWYTPTTGIWQTVWLEPVPKSFIRSVRMAPTGKLVQGRVGTKVVSTEEGFLISVEIANPSPDQKVQYLLISDRRSYSSANGPVPAKESVEISTSIPARPDTLWSPDQPNLLHLVVALTDKDHSFDLSPLAFDMPRVDDRGIQLPSAAKFVDHVQSYTALRKISLGKDERGVTRIMLNNKPVFQYGPLDQGFWPDGLYTAPTDEALRYDIEMTKKLGFNMIRKHVKTEPARWYYHCDKLGMLVWQDMPSGDKHAAWDPFGKHDNTEATRSPESSENYNREWRAIIDSLRNHPCIVMWVPFNEGWGQANTVAVTKWTKEYDPTRLVNCASGGNDFPVGDVIDVHRYPGPFAPKPTSDRAAVLGEFGGLGLPLEGHTWQGKDNWGYRSFTKSDDLQRAYVGLLGALRPMIAQGVSAAVYTQTTDVEIEVNGLMTYDRAVLKMDADVIGKAVRKLYLPPPKVTTLVPTSEQTAQTWRYTTDKPTDGWQKPAFDDASWKSGPGGFGEPTTPASVVKTNWKTNDIWLRREVDVKPFSTVHELALRIHHDEDTEVFLNGELIAKTTGYTTQYVEVPLDQKAVELLKGGKNTLAVHCKQTGGGQYIDVGLVDVEEVAPR